MSIGYGPRSLSHVNREPHMLERKRILKVQSDFEEEGRRVFVYEHAKSGDIFTIADPELNLDDMEKVQHDVALLMQYGLNPPTEDEGEAGDEESPGDTAGGEDNDVPDEADDADVSEPDAIEESATP